MSRSILDMYFEGVVESGRRLGRQLGFPTANVAVDLSLELTSGVYRSRVRVGDVWFDGVTNIGVNPTVGCVDRRSESYLIGFDEDIYGERITVEIFEKLRDEMRFESVEALVAQIRSDVESVILTTQR